MNEIEAERTFFFFFEKRGGNRLVDTATSNGYSFQFLRSSPRLYTLREIERGGMGNSMKKKGKKVKGENEKFEDVFEREVDDVVLMEEETVVCCSKTKTTSLPSRKSFANEGFTRLVRDENCRKGVLIGATPKSELKMIYSSGETENCNFEKVHEIRITALDTSRNQVFSGGRDNIVAVYDRKTRKCVSRCKIPRNLVTDACFCGENTVAQVGEDLSLKIWDTRDMKKPSQIFRGYKYFALSVCTLVENTTVVTSSTGHNGKGCELRVWDLRTGNVACKLKSHKQPTTCVSQVSQSHVLSGSSDGTVRLWDISSKSSSVLDVQDLGSPITSLDCLKGQSVSVAGTEDGSVWLLRHVNKTPLSSLFNN